MCYDGWIIQFGHRKLHNRATAFGGAIYNDGKMIRDLGDISHAAYSSCIITQETYLSPEVSPLPSLITMRSKVVMLYMPHPFMIVLKPASQFIL